MIVSNFFALGKTFCYVTPMLQINLTTIFVVKHYGNVNIPIVTITNNNIKPLNSFMMEAVII